uniref:Putative homing endonuclease n=1 Tax=viral metagenome TaxID=1070528 RepID=A0A6H2A0B5_9ZZZZ
MEIKKGFCQCDCGNKTRIAYMDNKKLGWVKGQPIRFINGHNGRGIRTGGKLITKRGYVRVPLLGHPRTDAQGYVKEHILIAEKALGKLLPEKAVIHHIDGNPSNNIPSNLVICQDNGYHLLLHRRQRAYKACGNANWIKCPYCKKYDDPNNNMYVNKSGIGFHRKCQREYYKDKPRYPRKAHDSPSFL